MADSFDQFISKFKSGLKEAIGDAIRRPISAKLGYQNEEGKIFLDVDKADADQPSQYYFSSAAGQSYVGQAYMQDGVLDKWQIRYGAPIRVKKDPVNGSWEIVGLDVIYAAEFFDGVDPEETSLIPMRRFEPGLLTSTIPYSMKAVVIGGAYDDGDDFKYISTQETINWGVLPYSAQVPTDPGVAKFVLVQLNKITETLSYKYGIEVPASMSFEQAYRFQVLAGNNDILPQKDTGYWRNGYIKLVGGQTTIDRREHIWSIQEVLGSSGGGAELAGTVLSKIVCTDTDVVVADGEVVWIE